VGSENAILGGQVFVPQQQFLIDQTCDKGQNACPMKLIAHGKNPSYASAVSRCALGRDEYFHHNGSVAYSNITAVLHEYFHHKGLLKYYSCAA